VKLLNALLSEELDLAEELLKAGADPNWTDDGRSLLCRWFNSSFSISPEVLEMLVRYGADLNLPIPLYEQPYERFYLTPLNCLVDSWVDAKRGGYRAKAKALRSLLRYMLELGASPERAPLSLYGRAAIYGYADLIAYLADVGAPLTTPVPLQSNISPPLSMAKNLKVARQLESLGADPLSRDVLGRNVLFTLLDTVMRSPVHMDWKVAPLSLVRHLVKVGNDPQERGVADESLVHVAASGGNVKALRYLLRLGLKAQDEDGEGDTPLHYAVRQRWLASIEGGLDVMDTLVDAGLHPDTPNGDGLTPLQLAVSLHRTSAALRLLRLGADPSLPYPDGRSLAEVFLEVYGEEAENSPLARHIVPSMRPSREPSPPRRVAEVLDLAGKVERDWSEAPVEWVDVVILYPAPWESAGVMRLGGKPVGVDGKRWPMASERVLKMLYGEAEGSTRRFRRWLKERRSRFPNAPEGYLPMEHLLTVDLRALPGRPKGVPEDAVALSIFLPVLEYGLGEYLAEGDVSAEEFYALVFSSEEDLRKFPADGEGAVALASERIRVPLPVFHVLNPRRMGFNPADGGEAYERIFTVPLGDGLLGYLTERPEEEQERLISLLYALKSALVKNSYAGGLPIYVQGPEGDDPETFIVQFSEEITEYGELMWVNFGSATYYVFATRMFGQA